MRAFLAALALLAAAAAVAEEPFDHAHAEWSAFLAAHQAWSADGHRSSVDYAGARADRERLGNYLASLGAVSRADFDRWSEAQQLAFLMNLYNAATVALILDAEDLPNSIRDLGSLFRSVWKQRFVALFGERVSLDHIEHGVLRQTYDEPLIHAGLVCASCSCPPLRDTAYTADTLEEALRDTMHRYLSDRGRNRVLPESRRIEVSRIFDWFGEDFEDESGRIEPFFAAWSDSLADDEAGVALLRDGAYAIRWVRYDWSLNAPGNCPG